MAFWLRTTSLTPPVTPVGNLILPTSWPAFLVAYASMTDLDVVSINHGAYVPSGAAEQFTLNRTFAGAGGTLIGASNQVVRIDANGLTAARTMLVNWTISGDAVVGNRTGGAPENTCVDIRNSSQISFWGCTITEGYFGVYLWGSGTTDITVRYCNISRQRHDGVRFDNSPGRCNVSDNSIQDNIPQEQAWWKIDNTLPIIASPFQTGYYFLNPDHSDGMQAFSGTATDIQIRRNYIKVNSGQGSLFSDGGQTRWAYTDNTVIASIPYLLMFDNATSVEVSRNAFSRHPDFDPDQSTLLILFARSGGTGAIRGGDNTMPGDTTVTCDISLVAAVSTIGSGFTAPADPTWSDTGANVGNLDVLKLGTVYVPYSGPQVMITPPSPRYDQNAVTAAAGVYLKAIPGGILGHVFNFETAMQTRWMKNGVQQATGTGVAAMVSPVTTAGTWRPDQSFNGTDWTLGTTFTVT